MIKQGFMTLVAASLISIGVPLASAQDNSANSQQAAPTQGMSQDNSANNGPDGGRGHRGPMDPAQRTAELTKKLNLSSDQQAKVQSILEAQRSQMESARQDSSAQQDRRAKMMELRKGTDTQIRAVLDSNQQKKWDDMQARREQREQEHRGGPQGQGQGQGGDQQGPPPSPQQ